MGLGLLNGSKNPLNIVKVIKYKRRFRKEHPAYFDPCGLIVFCGAQGTGKTLSAVQYIRELSFLYPNAILCTNTYIKGLHRKMKVIEYKGLSSLTAIENGYHGVIYFIDEIHLEFNSLESKNIPIEVMVEISQQRKQRKHIVGTSQQFLRMAKPLREQVKNIVICKNFFNCIQYNKLIDGDTIFEENGHVKMNVRKRSLWFHTPNLYNSYDTYAKMKRYRNDWQGTSKPTIFYEDERKVK